MTPARLRQFWSIITILLVVDLVIEAGFAGAILSGADWARRAHVVNAVILIASTALAGLAAIPTLRRISQGLKLGSALLSLAAVIGLQLAVGKLSAEGANLMWVHAPLGSALVGFAVLTAIHARRLGGE
ncbi:MAG: hypothetical protein ABMA14_26255 [Hyphomonadaceae bacterium]